MRLALLVLFAALIFGACGPTSGAQVVNGSSPALVVATNGPLAWVADHLTAGALDVRCLAPAGEDPAHWLPDDDDVARMQRAELILRVGAGHEPWAATVPLPASRMVDTTAAVADRLIATDTGPSHAHGMQGEHSHGATAFTVWLDPTLLAAQVRAAADALARLVPDDGAALRERERALLAALEALDARLAAAADAGRDRALLGSHPVYQYLQARYDLDLRSVHWEPDVDPGEAGWRELDALVAERPVVAMLWEAEPLPDVAARLAARGIESVVYAPAGAVSEAGVPDLLAVMTANAERLETLLTR